MQQAALLLILMLLRPRDANYNGELLVCGRIQTASEAPNERGPAPACVHALAPPVGRVWLLPQPDPWAPWRISMHLAPCTNNYLAAATVPHSRR